MDQNRHGVASSPLELAYAQPDSIRSKSTQHVAARSGVMRHDRYNWCKWQKSTSGCVPLSLAEIQASDPVILYQKTVDLLSFHLK
ncbi:MAG: hypothetical protein FJ308_00315 [Planctomycetes bacterium]|nr:hypothetical protein [Planctomycetota bacterium]